MPEPASSPPPPTAVLGPTNTGKTHLAIERMLGRGSGMIGLPLRLLAREVYDRIVAARGPREAALITGEEKIIPPTAKYFICTVEAMPLDREVDFVAIDEVQLAADPDRGHVFTSRLLHARGRHETLLLGSQSMRGLIQALCPRANFISRPRFSKLSYAGPKKLSRLPRRSAIVAFSAEAVYSIAELVRRQRGGAAVVLGALSPRTRNAQVALYQAGDVDFLVATDAIGMGLNLDVDHVAFAAKRKFDGRRPRELAAAELAQIAGRAGRHLNDGAFGVTAECGPFDEETIERIENHEFEPVRALQWRNEQLEFGSLPALRRSLERRPPRAEFLQARRADDAGALERLAEIEDIGHMARGGAALKRLWEICQIPDFRKTGADEHARLLAEIYRHVMGPRGLLETDWLAGHVERLDRDDGDVDALANRLSHIRTWTFVANRGRWLADAAYWQGRTREIEDRLSDALHERLMKRFVDRRTSVLAKRLRAGEPLLAGVTAGGEVMVEGEYVGRLHGFQFIVDPRARGAQGKAVRAAAAKALQPELATRAALLANADPREFSLQPDGRILWRDAVAGRLRKGPAPLRPDVSLVGAELLSPHMAGRIHDRLTEIAARKIETAIAPLLQLQRAVNLVSGADGDPKGSGIDGLARGIGFRLIENFGAVSRAEVAADVKALDQTERGKLRQFGVRFGEFSLYMPALLKPAPASMLVLLWALHEGRSPEETPPPPAGRVSIPLDTDIPQAYYYAAGFRPSGTRAVRIDMLERLAGLIRDAREKSDRRIGFTATPQMMSLVGCGGEDFEGVLASLGYVKNVMKKTRAEIAAEEAAKAEAAARKAKEAAEKTAAEKEAADKTAQEAADAAGAPEESKAATGGAPGAEAPSGADGAERAEGAEPSAQNAGVNAASADAAGETTEPAAAAAPESDAPESGARESGAPSIVERAQSADPDMEKPAPVAEETAASGAETAASGAETAASDAETAASGAETAASSRTAEPEDRSAATESGAAAPETAGDGAEPPAPAASTAPEPELTKAAGAAGEPESAEAHSTDASTDAAETKPEDEIVELVFWRLPPRKPAQPRQRRPRGASKGAKSAQAGDGDPRRRPGGKDKAAAGGKPNSDRGANRRGGPPGKRGKGRRDDRRRDDRPRVFSSGPKRDRKAVDPDSPFAALAALKSELEPDAGSKKPEKSENETEKA